MFVRDLTFGRQRVRIEISEQHSMNRGNSFIFGYPLDCSFDSIHNDRLDNDLNNLKGYFLYIDIDDDRITIANDIAAGYRLYYYKNGYNIYISDQYRSLLDIMKQYAFPEYNKHEYHFWKKHGYTTGQSTLVTNLHKLPPATIMEITSTGVESRLYFQDLPNRPNRKIHCRDIENDLIGTLTAISNQVQKIILFFSGGNDSTLLALMLKEFGANFEPIFIRATPPYRANQNDFLFAQQVAKYLDIKLTVIDVVLNLDNGRLREIACDMLFDRHFSVIHFEGLREIYKKYGTEAIIVNGQASDSILSFGPSGNTRGDFIARVLLYKPHSLWSHLASKLVQGRFDSQYSAPAAPDEYLRAFLDQFQYYTVTSKQDPKDYSEYLNNIIRRVLPQLRHRASLLMYLKLFGFIQGSDNQVVIRSAKAAGISKIILPFATPAIIYSTIKNKSDFIDLFRPKYAVSQCMKHFDYHRPTAEYSDDIGDFSESDAIMTRVEEIFDSEAKGLIGDIVNRPSISQ